MSDRFEETLSALLELSRLSDLSVSADGGRVTFVVEPAHKARGESAASRVWVGGADDALTQVTHGPGSDRLPAWSPDGQTIAFASDRDHFGRMSLFVHRSAASEAERLGSIDGFVEQLAWSPEGESLVVLAADPGLDAAAVSGATKLADAGQDPKVERPSSVRRRLFRVDLESGDTDEVGPSDASVWEFDLLDRSTAAAIISEDPRELGWYRSRLAILDLDERTHSEWYTATWQVQSVALSPSGDRIAFTEGWSSDRGLVAGELKVVDVASGAVIDLSDGTGDVTWVSWRDDDSLWFAGWDGLGARFGVVGLDGSIVWRRDDAATVGTSSFFGHIAPAEDRLFAIRETSGQPQEVVAGGADDEWTAVSGFNDAVGAGDTAVEEVEWEGANGEAIRGLLVTSADTERPLPLIVNVHGGPTYAWKHAYNPGGALLLAAAGYGVFLPNYRGSTGRGQHFTRANVGDPGGKEFEDITRGAAACVDRGIADPDRLGIMGASYGGYMTAWAVATSRMFSAAVMISGISDLLSCYYTCNNPPFYELIMERTPYDREDLMRYLDRSPIARIAGATTPTLILHGADDLCTPLGQAEEFYRALVDQDVPAELVVYPHEGHGFQERDHQVDSWRRIRTWFDTYLAGSAA